MANIIYSTIIIVGEKEFLDSFRNAIETCAEKMKQEGGDYDEVWALDVLECMHMNTKTLSVNTTRKVNAGRTWWYSPRFDEKGKNLIIEETCICCRSELLDFLMKKSNGGIKAYELLYSGLLPPDYGSIKERKEQDC